MRRLIKVLLFLAIIGFVGLSGYAYLGDLSPDGRPISEPVTLDRD